MTFARSPSRPCEEQQRRGSSDVGAARRVQKQNTGSETMWARAASRRILRCAGAPMGALATLVVLALFPPLRGTRVSSQPLVHRGNPARPRSCRTIVRPRQPRLNAYALTVDPRPPSLSHRPAKQPSHCLQLYRAECTIVGSFLFFPTSRAFNSPHANTNRRESSYVVCRREAARTERTGSGATRSVVQRRNDAASEASERASDRATEPHGISAGSQRASV